MNATLYWDNKALPTSTLTLPNAFKFNFVIISFNIIENKCLSEKKGLFWEKSSAKDGLELMSIASKSTLPSTPLKLTLNVSFFGVEPITR